MIVCAGNRTAHQMTCTRVDATEKKICIRSLFFARNTCFQEREKSFRGMTWLAGNLRSGNRLSRVNELYWVREKLSSFLVLVGFPCMRSKRKREIKKRRTMELRVKDTLLIVNCFFFVVVVSELEGMHKKGFSESSIEKPVMVTAPVFPIGTKCMHQSLSLIPRPLGNLLAFY